MTLACEPSPASSVSVNTLPLPRAEARGDPVQVPVAGDLGALGAEDPRLLVQVLGADEAQRGVLADAQLDDRGQHRLGVGGAGQVLLPDLGLGALLEHDQHAPVQRGAGGVGDRGQHDRLLDAHVARDVDERAAGPAGVVERREDVLLGVDDRAEVLLDEVGVGLAGERQRQHEQIVGGVAAVDHAAVDLPEMVRALGRLEQRLDAVDSARITLAGRDGGERRQVELGDVRELPARPCP